MSSPASSADSSRRRFLARGMALAAVPLWPQCLRAAEPTPFIDNREGGYRFLPAGAVFNSGALPLPGYEIQHVLLNPWVPLSSGWEVVGDFLRNASLPVKALCGMELRVPKQFTFDGFRAFNAPYIEQLRKWGLIYGEYSAVSRTNVAPGLNAPRVPSLHAFSYALPSEYRGVTFCVSGTADLDPAGKIVEQGNVSREGMKLKLRYVIDVISDRLSKLGVSWADATHTDLCVVRDIGDLMETVVVPGLKGAAARGVRVHFAQPPIIDLEVELETRGVHSELVLRT
jgi:hypothetical protein